MSAPSARTLLSRPSVVDRGAWRVARDEVAQLEQAEAEARDRANEARRALPATLVTGDYRFADGSGELQLEDLFQGREQLVLYHFMYAPEWTSGCPHCTQFADAISPGTVRGLADRGITLALASRAPAAQLEQWRERHGWQIPWYSIDDAFASDFGSLVADGDRPRINAFVRDGDRVLHTFQAEGREYELVMPVARWLDFTPLGDPADAT